MMVKPMLSIVLLRIEDLTLPLRNPVIIFSLVLFIILFSPILFNRIKVPHIIGLILAGVIIGPYGLNLLLRDSSMVLFGTVGLLYIMFTAGLEIDIDEFKKNRAKSFVFGILTFAMPMALGFVAGRFILGFSVPASILLAATLASHTLLAYPIASKYGLSKIRSVTMAIGGTIVTDTLALLVLAAVAGMTQGNIDVYFWLRLALSSIAFGAVVFFVFPMIARWFFKKFDDHVSQYIFVLAIVFLGSFLAELAGLEAIIGAFLSGLTLNRFIPSSSALMNRIEFVGNAFFIPFFLIGVGMLVDVRVIFQGSGALKVAGVMIVMAILTKFIAAWLTQKSFRLLPEERRMIFGLSTARVGATLAVVLVGYNLIVGETATGEPIRLLGEDVLNGAILMILVTCTVSSFVTERAARRLALNEDIKKPVKADDEGRILISLAYSDTVNELVDMGMMLKPRGSLVPVNLLHIVTDDDDGSSTVARGRKLMEKAMSRVAVTENNIIPLTRFDQNISNAIVYTIREQNITDVLIGLHHSAEQHDFLGPVTERIIKRTYETIYIYKSTQPVNTLRRMLVVVPPRAELEPGFAHWFIKLVTICKEAGMSLTFYASPATLLELEDQRNQVEALEIEFNRFTNWDDFLIFSRELRPDDLFVIVSSRKGHVSYNNHLNKMPYYLTKYFRSNSFIIVYPKQLEHGVKMDDVEHVDSTLMESISGNVGRIGAVAKRIKGLFGNRQP
jgi:Kef-type K+ transport system membrane component KefB